MFSEGASIILTPHFIDELLDDGFLPDEKSVLGTGIFNLGFVAFQKKEESLRAIDWWMKKCKRDCVNELENGVFVDQKWANYFPSRYENVYVLRDYGYNVAYWNIWERALNKKNEEYYVKDRPLTFFHFSSINWGQGNCLFKYTERLLGEYFDITKELIDDYKKKMLDAGHDRYKNVRYAYNYFFDGRKIEQLFRRYYRKHKELEDECGDNPFEKSFLFYDETCYLKRYYEWHELEQRKSKLKRITDAKTIVIFGKGHNGKRLYEVLKEKGLDKNVACFCDNKIANKTENLDTLLPQEAIRRYQGALFLITPEGKDVEIIGQLLREGLDSNNIMIFGIKEVHEVLLNLE